MFSQMQGLYNAAALDGGAGIREAFQNLARAGSLRNALVGGWDPNMGWSNDPNAVAAIDGVSAKYQLPPHLLRELAQKIYTYDSLIMLGRPKDASQYKKGLQLNDDMKKIWNYLRRKVHLGGTRRKITKAMRARAAQMRADRLLFLRKNPWYGSDPINPSTNIPMHSYIGLSAWRPKKGEVGYIDYRLTNPFTRLAQSAAQAAAQAAPGAPPIKEEDDDDDDELV